MKINATMLDAVRQAESKLANQEKQAKGDLADLPTGHPLLAQLEASKNRLEKASELKKQLEQTNELKFVRKAKQGDIKKQEKERDIEREAKIVRTVEFSKEFNKRLELASKQLTDLCRFVGDSGSQFEDVPYLKANAMRVIRTAQAVEKLLRDSRIKPYRLDAEI